MFVVAVVPVHSFASAVTLSATGAEVSDGCDVLSSGEHGVDEADSSWSSPSQRSDDGPFILLDRRFLESRSMGLLMAVPLLKKLKIKMRREPRWSRDEVQ